jgi:fermentation-respiration switch protein FrsA (DUF1100 family)
MNLAYSEVGMREYAARQKVRFVSGDTECAAWHYPGTNGACVIMAGGGGVTKQPGTDPFAKPFHGAGFTVLAIDYRHLGESGGRPRQIVRVREQLADWRAAIAFAPTEPFLVGYERAVGAELWFLRRHLLEHQRASGRGAAVSAPHTGGRV